MSSFRYKLDPGPKKFICPKCSKNRFVKYIDTRSGDYYGQNYGRCDRESACGFHSIPKTGKTGVCLEFLSLSSISPKAYKLTDKLGSIIILPKSQVLEIGNSECYVSEWFLKQENKLNNSYKVKSFDEVENTSHFMTQERPIPLKPSFHSLELVQDMFCDHPVKDNLTLYLESIFPKEMVLKKSLEYLLTGTNHYWNGSTVFWQIDEREKVHGGKIMNYDQKTGKRIKTPYPRINWIHNAIKEKDFKLSQCLFGQHLLTKDYEIPVCLVESEKTALIMSFFVSNVHWLATGSKQNLKPDLLKCLENRKIILFPDKGDFENWKDKASKITHKQKGISISRKMEESNLETGSDIADLYLKTKL